MGVLYLLKVVNETRVGFTSLGGRQFFSLLKKPDVHSVLLAKGGIKVVERKKSSTDHPLNQAWNQSNINRIGQSFNFSNYRLGKTTKKMGAIFEQNKLYSITASQKKRKPASH